MTINTEYPGVYIEEVNNLSLSVSQSSTAVPAFAIDSTTLTSSFVATEKDYYYIENYMDYLACRDKTTDAHIAFDTYMRVYFNNGGGACYLIDSTKFEAKVPQLNRITLLVEAGTTIEGLAGLLGLGRNLFAILDGPNEDLSAADTNGFAPDPASEYAAYYYPWLTATATGEAIPPSVAVAGAYCRNDRTIGVWKAPANMPLVGIMPQFGVSDSLQGLYTKSENALNMIRQFGTSAPTIWGARTTNNTPQWRYIPVRRLFNSAEKDIKDAMKVAMFEPNSQPTWEAIRAAVTNYLTKLWKSGALQGTKPEEAFFVEVGLNQTMNQAQIDDGELIVRVGMAAVRPAEFIILQFTQDIEQ